MPARREGVDVDPVDLPGDGERAEIEAAAGRALGAERDLEVLRHERQLRLGLGLQELDQVAPEPERELAPLEVGKVDADAARERLVEALAHEADRVVQVVRRDPLDAERLRQARVELVQRVVGDRAAQLRVHLPVDLPRRDHALDEPHRGAVGEGLQLGRGEDVFRRQLLDDQRVPEARRALGGRSRSLEPPLPVVRARDRLGLGPVAGREPGQRPQALALRRRLLDRPGEMRERALRRRTPHVVRVEAGARFVPERARLPRRALVGGRLADEVEPLRRPRAGGVEEVALARDRVGPLQARLAGEVELAAGFVVEERRGGRTPGQAALLQTEHEDDLVAAAARPHQVDHVDAAGLLRAGEPDLGALERGDDVLAGELASERRPRVELVGQLERGLVRAQVERRLLARRRRVEAVRGAEHERREDADGLDGRGGGPQRLERRQRLAAQLRDDLLDALVPRDRAPAQPPFEVVGMRTGDPGVRRAEEAEELAPSAAVPVVVEQPEQRLAERRSVEPEAPFDRVGDAERAECGLDRAPVALQRGDDERDLLGRGAGAEQREQLLGHELERASRAGALEEAHRTLERRRVRVRLGEERPLEVRERRPRERVVGRRQLLDPAAGERRQVVGGAAEAREDRAPGLVRERDGHVGAARERLEQAPLGRGQVLEAVGEDGRAAPGLQLARHPLGRAPLLQLAVGEAEPLELGAVAGVERREVAVHVLGSEHPPLEVGDRLEQGVGEAGEAGRAAEAVQARAAEHARRRAAGAADPTRRAAARRSTRTGRGRCRSGRRRAPPPRRAGRAGRGRRPTGSARSGRARRRGALDSAPAGARPYRRSRVLRSATAACRPIVVRTLDGSRAPGGAAPAKERKDRRKCARRGRSPAARERIRRRPTSGAGRAGRPAGRASFPAHSSQRSACFAPRRASVNVTRSVAPFDSPTSLPQLSQTRTVFRATNSSWERDRVVPILVEITLLSWMTEFATTEAAREAPSPRPRGRPGDRALPANSSAGNPRWFSRRDTARRPPD